MSDLYLNDSKITGELQNRDRVAYRKTLSVREKISLGAQIGLMLASTAAMLWILFKAAEFSSFSITVVTLLATVALVEIIRLVQTLTLGVFAIKAKDPIPMEVQTGVRIAILTTMVPGKEPWRIISKTLRKMKKIEAGEGNTVDVWLLDEGNDKKVQQACERIGVKHFSRKGVPEWNTEAGPYRAKTKHGNHNSWRAAHEDSYDIVAQMDPDHVPFKNFLERTIGYFRDPEVGFVVAPQVYGNMDDNWIAKASATLAYVFHGVIQRGGNGMSAPLLIGTNHLYRVMAFKDINGYQDCIIEDHLTSMEMFNSKRWKGVYTPDILSVGEGPTTFTDFFNQQQRWAYGIWEILRSHSFASLKKMSPSQRLTFAMLQFFYPSLAVAWVLSSITAVMFSIVTPQYENLGSAFIIAWLMSFASSLGLFFWSRRFNLASHERNDWAVSGIILTLMTLPVYVNAAWQAIRGIPLTYAVTAKGKLASQDTLETFKPHLMWIGISVISAVIILINTSMTVTTALLWTLEHIVVCALPVSVFLIKQLRESLKGTVIFAVTRLKSFAS